MAARSYSISHVIFGMALITQVASPAFLALPSEQVNNHKVSCTKSEARLDVSTEIENAALINTHVVRLEMRSDQLLIELAHAKATNSKRKRKDRDVVEVQGYPQGGRPASNNRPTTDLCARRSSVRRPCAARRPCSSTHAIVPPSNKALRLRSKCRGSNPAAPTGQSVSNA
jgi:hypothetical protein